jgi:hypothetical protein
MPYDAIFVYTQRDADEAYSQLVYTMHLTLKTQSEDPVADLLLNVH